jgi:hypothetical protein
MTSLLASPTFATVLLPLHHFGLLLAQAGDDASIPQTQGSPLAGAIGGGIGLVIALIVIVSMWKVFAKAGRPGWASIIPIYNFYVMCKVAGKPGWWLILMCVPFVNFIILILVCCGMAGAFGKGTGFGLGLAFLSFIFLPILAFGDARYQGGLPAPASVSLNPAVGN